MDKINKLFKEFKYVVDNPGKMVEEHKRETGLGAVGIMPVYSPEEIVHASGYLPIGIWGGQKKISKARTYLPPFACSIMQSILEMQIEGKYDDLDCVIFSVPCDTLKCMSQKWKGKSDTIVFTHPQNRKIEAANKFLQEEFKILKSRLEKILKIKITDKKIEESIEIYNKNREIMREFTVIANNYPHIIDAVKRHNVIKSRFFIEKSKHTKMVGELIEELKKQEEKTLEGKRVILNGITAEPDELLSILNRNNLMVVGDNLAQESRQFRINVPDGRNSIERLAKWWQEFDGCSLAGNVNKPIGEMLIDMVEKTNADAVINCMMKFCDPEEFDYPIYYQELKEKGIKILSIEIDQESESFEQISTRVQSFTEML